MKFSRLIKGTNHPNDPVQDSCEVDDSEYYENIRGSETDMNPSGDLDKITLQEMVDCIEGDTSKRRDFDASNLFVEDPWYLEAEEIDSTERSKTKNVKDSFPGYTYPMEGFETGLPYSEQVPVYTNPMEMGI